MVLFFFVLVHFCVFHNLFTFFPSCLIPSIANDTHIIDLALVIFQTYYYYYLVRFGGLVVQFCKYVAWSILGLLSGFSFLLSLCTLIRGIMVLGVLLGLFSFTSFFLHDILDNDVQHMNAFPKLGDVQLALGIFICCFSQKPYYFFRSFLPFLDFQRQLTSFDSTLIHVFERFLKQGFLECLEVPLICQQVSLGVEKLL